MRKSFGAVAFGRQMVRVVLWFDVIGQFVDSTNEFHPHLCIRRVLRRLYWPWTMHSCHQNITRFWFWFKYHYYAPIKKKCASKSIVSSVINAHTTMSTRSNERNDIIVGNYGRGVEKLCTQCSLSCVRCISVSHQTHTSQSRACIALTGGKHELHNLCSPIFTVWRWCERMAESHIIRIHFRWCDDDAALAGLNSSRISCRDWCPSDNYYIQCWNRREFHSHLIVSNNIITIGNRS